MAHLVHGNAGVAAWLTFGAMRPFGLGGTAAQTGTHELLPGVAGHTARLRVPVLHSLLLRIHLRAGGIASAISIASVIRALFIGVPPSNRRILRQCNTLSLISAMNSRASRSRGKAVSLDRLWGIWRGGGVAGRWCFYDC